MSAEAEDLEALFDSIAQTREESQPAPAAAAASASASASAIEDATIGMYEQVGRCTRQLHDAMRQLGYDQTLSRTTNEIVDAKDRLEYVAELTEKAANRVLNAIDEGMPEEDMLLKQSKDLSAAWEQLYEGRLSVEEFKSLAAQSRDFAALVSATAERQKARMMEIMMAQDFQDITGQIIKKIVTITQSHEQELMKILRDNAPEIAMQRMEEKAVDLMAGPAIPTNALAQDDVDDLLADLGF